jgi:FAD-dependent urate hydroxylase
MLRAMGLGEALDRVSAPLARWTFCDRTGEELCETDLEALWGEPAPGRGVTRQRLQEVLLAGAAGVPVRLGVAVTSLQVREDGVSVSFSDGSRATYAFVVGADGIASTVRRCAG